MKKFRDGEKVFRATTIIGSVIVEEYVIDQATSVGCWLTNPTTGHKFDVSYEGMRKHYGTTRREAVYKLRSEVLASLDKANKEIEYLSGMRDSMLKSIRELERAMLNE